VEGDVRGSRIGRRSTPCKYNPMQQLFHILEY
jgi:hypothetical protein